MRHSESARAFRLRVLLAGLALSSISLAQVPGEVKSFQKISMIEGGFTGSLDNLDRFGVSCAVLV